MNENDDQVDERAPSRNSEPITADGQVSRRKFLINASLGASALVPTLGCTTNAAAQAQRGGRLRPQQMPVDNWVEPWEFRVGTHDDGPLSLNVVEVLAPAWLSALGPDTLFTYNGTIPGPTIRMRGNDVLRVDLFNHLSGNDGKWAHHNSARFAKTTKVRGYSDVQHPDGVFQPNEIVPDIVDWRLARTLIYGPHDQHTTNLHTHGLHVAPARNPDGTHSDNVLLRIVPPDDLASRMEHDPPLPLNPVHEQVGRSLFEFRLGASSGTPTHPPGTHWYHPHPHGATYDQVSTGMAGLLIVEGDVDDAINTAMAAQLDYEYRERLIVLQRIFDVTNAPIVEGEDRAGRDSKGKGQRAIQTVNGQPAGTLAFEMKAGAVERWRLLNGSVDGQGFIRFVVADSRLSPPVAQTFEDNQKVTDWALTNGLSMQNLAFDGVTLVTEDGRHTTREVNALQLAPANRADFLFQAPQTPGAFTIWGVGDNHRAGDPAPPATKIASLTVTARPNPPPMLAADYFPNLLRRVPVPEYLMPITGAEIGGTDPTNNRAGSRTRRVVYSGWGDGGYQCPQTCKPLDEKGKNSMVINRMKFDPDRPVHRMALDTAEEWVLDNFSVGKPLSPGGAVDHPFHMHQNPFWVMAILEPVWTNAGTSDAPVWQFDGWTNTLDHPRWQDVVPIPNSGGRVIFRSRFPDYTGFYVNHCHLLQHEDWGMMQAVEIVWDPVDANNDWDQTPYDPRSNPDGPYRDPKPSLQEMLDYCQTFYDLDGQIIDGTIVGGTPVDFCDCT